MSRRNFDQQAQKKDEGFQMIVEKVPWVLTTPSRTTASTLRTDATVQPKESEQGLAPQSVVTPTVAPAKDSTEDALIVEERKLLEYLRGVQVMMPLPSSCRSSFRNSNRKSRRFLQHEHYHTVASTGSTN